MSHAHMMIVLMLLVAMPLEGQDRDVPPVPRIGEVDAATWVDQWESTGGSPVWAPQSDGCEVGADWEGKAVIDEFLSRQLSPRLTGRLANYLKGGLSCPGVVQDVRNWYHEQLRLGLAEETVSLLRFLIPLRADTSDETAVFLKEYISEGPALREEVRDEIAVMFAGQDDEDLRFIIDLVVDGTVSARGYSRVVRLESVHHPGRFARVLGEAVADRPELTADGSWMVRTGVLALLHEGEQLTAATLGQGVAQVMRSRPSSDKFLVRFLRSKGLISGGR